MRTQTVHDSELERASWQLPRVDPTGWLAGRPGEAVRSWPSGEPSAGVVRRRRPRRTEAARAARERQLARRRRRRRGRAVVADHQVGTQATIVEWSPRQVASMRRVAEPARGTRMDDSTYRIGRWGRLALTLVVAATMALVIARLAGSAAGASPGLVDITVRPGDTLWSIASSASPDRDPRAVIDDIRELNDVRGDVVRVGEVLRVPASAG